jgi:uncharacterized protein YbaR (Trm112 family)
VPLEMLSEATLARLNAMIGEARIKDLGQATVIEPIEEALVTRDGRVAYPIRDGIPVLLEDHGIQLSQVNDP